MTSPSDPLGLEPEDLEPMEIEELESLNGDSDSVSPGEIVMDQELKNLLDRFKYSAIPFLLVTRDLKVIRSNETFLYRFSLNEEEINNRHLLSFFSIPDEEERANLPRHTNDPERHFYWKGYGELIRKLHKTEKTNIIIGPAEYPPQEEPRLYFCIFDIITVQINELILSTFKSLLDASTLKDNDTGNHISRVGSYSRLMAEALFNNSRYPEITFDFVEDISFLAAMHDVGKIGTPDDTLNKEGPLNDWEWEIMKEHTINGAYILSTYPNPMAKEIALFHHEWWNGSGYPYAIQGEQIPISARIVMISDVYDALRMKRSYKPALSHEKAVEIIKDDSKTHFDPELVELFEELAPEYNKIFERLKDDDTGPAHKHRIIPNPPIA